MPDPALAPSPSSSPPGGDFVCPECRRFKHKRVAFPNNKELGKHRRFIHKIPGSSYNARRRRELQTLQTKAAKIEGLKLAEEAKAAITCPECDKTFSEPYAARKRGIHLRFAHGIRGDSYYKNQINMKKRNPDHQPRPLPNGHLVLTPKETHASSSTESHHYAPTIPTEAYAILAGSILKEIRTFADTHGFVARDFTSGVVEYLRAASVRQ